MGIGRSTFYDTPDARARDLTIVAEMKTICDEFEAYGYRRVGAELRHRGIVVNAKKIRRLMREHALLQHPQTSLRAWLSNPCAIRGSPRPATCQKRRLKLSTIRGALHRRADFSGPL